MAHLPFDPARIGGARFHDARDFLFYCAHFGGAVAARRIDMIERRCCAQKLSGGGKAPFMFGKGIGIENILSRNILHMHKGFRVFDLRAERLFRGQRFARRAIGVAV